MDEIRNIGRFFVDFACIAVGTIAVVAAYNYGLDRGLLDYDWIGPVTVFALGSILIQARRRIWD